MFVPDFASAEDSLVIVNACAPPLQPGWPRAHRRRRKAKSNAMWCSNVHHRARHEFRRSSQNVLTFVVLFARQSGQVPQGRVGGWRCAESSFEGLGRGETRSRGELVVLVTVLGSLCLGVDLKEEFRRGTKWSRAC